MRRRFTRVPPAGDAIGRALARIARGGGDPDRALRDAIAQLCGAERVTLHASGREALRVALGHLTARSGRREVVVPAYTCFSIAAAAVAAGARVRLVDVTPEGRIDPDSLARQPLDEVAAVVVSNLFGVAEPTAALRRRLDPAGVALVDDAAQALGARAAEGPVGGRGAVGLLSFGRGKPLAALGGGALAWTRSPEDLDPIAPARPRRALALARALAHDLALAPAVFRVLAAIPALHVGETIFDPGFRRGAIDGASLCLAASRLPDLEEETRRRRARAEALAERLRDATRFAPLVAGAGCGVHPRLAVRAPDARRRDAALSALAPLGASRLYPTALGRIAALRPHLTGGSACPGAEELAGVLLTLPTHSRLRPAKIDEIVRTLERLS